MKNHARLLALVLLAVPVASARAVTFADDFSVASPAITSNAAFGSFNGGSILAAPGVSRVVFAGIESNDAPGDARVRSVVTNGAFSFSSDAEVDGYGKLLYGFAPSDLTGKVLNLDFLSYDVGGTIEIDLFGSSSAHIVASVPAHGGAFSFSSGSLTGNLTGVTGISFLLNPGQGGDLRLDRVRLAAVPEPAALATVTVGLFGLRRRRRG